MAIQIFITGGTIAKCYDEIKGELVFDAEHLTKMLSEGRATVSVDIETLMLKDSLDIDDVDREIIYQSCISTEAEKILILHGTDTMVETAAKLSEIKDKTIVLTGAMVPFAFKGSDALFNIGSALGALGGALAEGVYLAMNGQIFVYNNVYKDKERGEFCALS
jgi:L-asparaginase